MDRWSESEAQAWWRSRQWPCGFNFLPSTAVNFIEMWHAETFDLATIERELNLAAQIGFNAMRVNLPFIGWQRDREGLLDRLDRVLAVATTCGITTVPCLFDDCGFGQQEPVWARQAEPIPGVHNSRAVASPGRQIVLDASQRPHLAAYVRDVITSFRSDKRLLFWDLYNEPGNRMNFDEDGFSEFNAELESAALSLMETSFKIAREVNPEAPLSVAAWNTPTDSQKIAYQTDIDRSAILHSDIVTFHAYWNCQRVSGFIEQLKKYNRPMLCTEWMARSVDSRISDQLGLFHQHRVGCFQWGLVKGRTQTWLPWPEALVQAHGGQISSGEWFHDLLDVQGVAWDRAELDLITRYTSGTSLHE